MKITVIPAIDVIGGKCVRLTRGNYDECKTYYNDPVEAARHFEDMGMRRLHLVDLDGARESRVINWRVLERICEATRLEVDCIGSMAQQNREKTREWLERYGAERIIIGADVRDGHVCIQGWKVETKTTIHELIETYLPGVKNVMCTDIARDGMLGGVSLELYRELVALYPDITLIASGGVGSLVDIQALEEMGVSAVIVGKAFYEKFKM